ncbi:hemolysin-III related-domain-containing protein [Obelidium mucronatum]|nr:hemolysin-III related-domain-containing protein [Obelidium mucronatum]
MPDWYQHEKFIWSGYRPINPSIKACILSLFTHVHNETGNIWTHLIGSILFIALTGFTWGYLFRKQGLVGVDWRDHLIAAELHLSVISCFTFSTLFHTMCCHSQTVHRSCLKADYVGIVFHIGGCFLASVYYLFYCNETLRIVYMSLIFGTGLAVTVTNVSKRFLKREYAKLRLGLFIAFGMIGIFPIAHACVLYGFSFTQRAIGLNYIFLVALSNLGGSMIFNFRIPERFAPGAFDYWGQSHQIMHVCIVMGAISHYLGFIQAFQFWHFRNGDCVIPLIEMDLQAASTSGW